MLCVLDICVLSKSDGLERLCLPVAQDQLLAPTVPKDLPPGYLCTPGPPTWLLMHLRTSTWLFLFQDPLLTPPVPQDPLISTPVHYNSPMALPVTQGPLLAPFMPRNSFCAHTVSQDFSLSQYKLLLYLRSNPPPLLLYFRTPSVS